MAVRLEMWKKLFRSYGNVCYLGYHMGCSRGTVERERNEVFLTLWAAATFAAKNRDRWRQVLSLAQSFTLGGGGGGNIQHGLECRSSPSPSTQIEFIVKGISYYIHHVCSWYWGCVAPFYKRFCPFRSQYACRATEPTGCHNCRLRYESNGKCKIWSFHYKSNFCKPCCKPA